MTRFNIVSVLVLDYSCSVFNCLVVYKLNVLYLYKLLSVNAKKITPIANRSDPERYQPEHRDSLKSYTPQIRYTKLEFKVICFHLSLSFMLV